MKRSLWFDASMLILVLIAATVGSTLERGSTARDPASSQSASSTAPAANALR